MKQCLVCNCSNFLELYENTLLQCNDCGFVTANTEVSDEKLREIYSENYFKGEEYLDYLKDKSTHQYNFRRRLTYLLKRMDSMHMDTALEIGCAYGFFGEIFSRKFPEKKYFGIDISEAAIHYGQDVLKLNVICDDYLTFKSADTYSDVFMWDVIEHLKQPDLFLEKVYREIKPEGRLFLTTGDIGAIIPRIRKNKWRMIHPPSHLHYFSANTVKKLLNNKGFEIFFMSYPPVYRSFKQIFYSFFLLNKKRNPIFDKIFRLLPQTWILPINTYDIMFIGARKV